jgi:heptosyltransferase-2/heptosyltransferase-3
MQPLIVRFAAFGDVVLLTSLIEALHQRFGAAVDILGSGAWTPQLLRHDPRVGDIQLVSSRKAHYLLCPSQWRAVSWLRNRPTGPVYLCEPDAKSQWLLDRAGVPRDCVLRAFDFPASEQVHFSEWWQQIGRLTPPQFAAHVRPSTTPIDPVPRLYPSALDRSDCKTWLRLRGLLGEPLILIQPGNKRTLKRGRIAALGDNKYWPIERWAALVRELLDAEPRAQILLCGVPSEAGITGAIRQQANSARVHDLSMELPVRRLLPLLERAAGMISVDTGPAHAAAALDCPLVVMFGDQDQRVWRPRSRLGRVIAIGGAAGAGSRLRDISVAQTVTAWRQLPKRIAPGDHDTGNDHFAQSESLLSLQRSGGASNR